MVSIERPRPAANGWILRRAVILAAATLALAAVAGGPTTAQSGRSRALAVLETASALSFPSPTDSNSPSVWLMARGMLLLVVLNSAPDPVLSAGPALDALSVVQPTAFRSAINGARWIESVVPDYAGRLYGYYHNEPAGLCPDHSTKTAPRIGAAKSLDGGRTWVDLGIVIEAPAAALQCSAPNRYFAGGVGDFSVILDRAGQDLYFLFSAYGPPLAQQGVSMARMRWSDRNQPQGQVAIWSDGAWRYPEPVSDEWVYPAASPVLPARVSWYSPRGTIDGFWGPSVHWNTFLNRYVMLLNRAEDAEWTQEGIYLSSTVTIEDPTSWSTPQKLLDGGRWYPQVMGLEAGTGTDTLAGARARFFMSGTSEHRIVFQPREGLAVTRP